MAKTIQDIKAAANELQQRARLGQFNERALYGIVNDLANYLAALQAPPVATTVAEPATGAVPPAPVAEAPKKRQRKSKVTISADTVPEPEVKVGTQTPEAGAGENRVLPNTARVGRGVRVGSAPTNTGGVTVGSAPVNPAGQVTVGGRTVNR